jgi:cytochrome c-type biogenesis protein CcmH/NrfG
MTQSSQSSSSWTSTQAYVLAIICLVIGVAVGYFVRGSASPVAAGTEQAAATQAAPAGMGGGMGGMDPSKVTPDQLKHMVEKQVEPQLQQLKSNPNDPALLAQVGNVYYDTQLYQDAIGYYEKALNGDPKNVGVRTDMGTAYFYLGDADRAITEFNKALATDPKHGQTLYNLGMVQWQGKGDVNAAVAAWESLLKNVPDYPDRAKVEQLVAKAKEHSKMKPGEKTNKPASM